MVCYGPFSTAGGGRLRFHSSQPTSWWVKSFRLFRCKWILHFRIWCVLFPSPPFYPFRSTAYELFRPHFAFHSPMDSLSYRRGFFFTSIVPPLSRVGLCSARPSPSPFCSGPSYSHGLMPVSFRSQHLDQWIGPHLSIPFPHFPLFVDQPLSQQPCSDARADTSTISEHHPHSQAH
ncbi:hypothetical protein K443DRAFT_359567 [Laccaria amethystina LaAM-08-1]|jgi:hypothetical protein|uniref:Uncharacterized protein n=1 Tax=Laccaria amethystina LaAM-08-1 TaxID=1095629 RepID=A0A0C9XUB5_9AGAR|nr:hypothetical protein K443DRAFT_359567 [Laccaria amethystina LaAM-08-1]